jgi:hypothetical protein
LCAINNEEIVEAVDTSAERGTPSAFDGQALLTTIIPPILTEPGKREFIRSILLFPSELYSYFISDSCRHPIPARTRVCNGKQLCSIITRPIDVSVSKCRPGGSRIFRVRCSSQGCRFESRSQVCTTDLICLNFMLI